MGWLDTIKDSVSSAWESASSAASKSMQSMFGANAEQAAALARLNRTLSVAVGIRASEPYLKGNPEVRKAYAKLYRDIRVLLDGIAEADPKFRIVLPSDMDLCDVKCVQCVSRTQWHAQVKKLNANGSSINGLGVAPVIIVVAVVAIGVTVLGTSYLLTSEGRQRMAVAASSADAAAAIVRAVADGKLTPAEAQAMLDKLPPTPPPGGGLFDSVGKVAVLGGLGLLGIAYFTGKLSMPAMPKLGGMGEDHDEEEDNRELMRAGMTRREIEEGDRELRRIERESTLKPVIRKKNDAGDYAVVIKQGRRVVNGPYFTPDKDDAKSTARLMLEESKRKGLAGYDADLVQDLVNAGVPVERIARAARVERHEVEGWLRGEPVSSTRAKQALINLVGKGADHG